MGDFAVVLGLFFQEVGGEAAFHRLPFHPQQRAAVFAQLQIELGARGAFLGVQHSGQVVFVELRVELLFDLAPGLLGNQPPPLDDHQFGFDDLVEKLGHIQLPHVFGLFLGGRALTARGRLLAGPLQRAVGVGQYVAGQDHFRSHAGNDLGPGERGRDGEGNQRPLLIARGIGRRGHGAGHQLRPVTGLVGLRANQRGSSRSAASYCSAASHRCRGSSAGGGLWGDRRQEIQGTSGGSKTSGRHRGRLAGQSRLVPPRAEVADPRRADLRSGRQGAAQGIVESQICRCADRLPVRARRRWYAQMRCQGQLSWPGCDARRQASPGRPSGSGRHRRPLSLRRLVVRQRFARQRVFAPWRRRAGCWKGARAEGGGVALAAHGRRLGIVGVWATGPTGGARRLSRGDARAGNQLLAGDVRIRRVSGAAGIVGRGIERRGLTPGRRPGDDAMQRQGDGSRRGGLDRHDEPAAVSEEIHGGGAFAP